MRMDNWVGSETANLIQDSCSRQKRYQTKRHKPGKVYTHPYTHSNIHTLAFDKEWKQNRPRIDPCGTPHETFE